MEPVAGSMAINSSSIVGISSKLIIQITRSEQHLRLLAFTTNMQLNLRLSTRGSADLSGPTLGISNRA